MADTSDHSEIKIRNIQMKIRCEWAESDPLYMEYHDKEWGTPVRDDSKLFEFLILESAQAGLSWITVLRKRQNYANAFDHFNPEKIAQYNEKKIQTLLTNKGIIRNKKKIQAAVRNAAAFLNIQNDWGSFSEYIWQFIGGNPKHNSWKRISKIPAKTEESTSMSKDLKQRGFVFVGPTICYAFMQAVGMVNDHVVDCFRYGELINRSD